MAEKMRTRAQKAQKDRRETQRQRNNARNTGAGASFLRAKTSHGRLKK